MAHLRTHEYEDGQDSEKQTEILWADTRLYSFPVRSLHIPPNCVIWMSLTQNADAVGERTTSAVREPRLAMPGSIVAQASLVYGLKSRVGAIPGTRVPARLS
jgi:hypothetical protein